MRRAFAAGLCALGLGALGLGGCTALTDAAVRTQLPESWRPATHDVETLSDQGFTTRDGVRLNAEVHIPRGVTKAPVILTRMPYSDTLWNRLRADGIARYWAAHGYVVVLQGTRGRFHSGGAFTPLVHEREDGIETLAWIAKQPWHDGRIGMWGGSAFGHTVWAVYDNADPDVDAGFVQIASTSFEDFFHPGGAFALESALYWALNSHGAEDAEVDYKLLDKGVRGWPAIAADDRALKDIPFFNDWARRDPAYWRIVDGERRAEAARAPMLYLGGWYDPFLPSMLRDYAALKRNPLAGPETRLVVGPFAHAREIEIFGKPSGVPYRQASVDPAIQWFDARFGRPGAPPLPPVRIYVMGENVWRDEQEWPLARTQWTRLHLGADGSLSETPHAGAGAAKRFTYDPENPVPTVGGAMLGARAGMKLQPRSGARPDVLTFSGPLVMQAMELTGPISATLWAASDAPSTDFTAKLMVTLPGGKAWNIADGVARVRPPGAGQPFRVDIDLGATSIVLPRGAKLRLDVSSSNFPRFDRNPNTGASTETATGSRKAEQTVFLSEDRSSYVTLPVIPR